jgi:hypothetical protein
VSIGPHSCTGAVPVAIQGGTKQVPNRWMANLLKGKIWVVTQRVGRGGLCLENSSLRWLREMGPLSFPSLS